MAKNTFRHFDLLYPCFTSRFLLFTSFSLCKTRLIIITLLTSFRVYSITISRITSRGDMLMIWLLAASKHEGLSRIRDSYANPIFAVTSTVHFITWLCSASISLAFRALAKIPNHHFSPLLSKMRRDRFNSALLKCVRLKQGLVIYLYISNLL